MATDIVDANGVVQGSSQVLSNLHQLRGYGPGYKSNNYFAATNIGHRFQTTATAAAITTGILYLLPFHCLNTQLFQSIVGWCVAGSAATNINMGIYNNLNGAPTGDPLTGSTSGSIATTSSGAAVSFTFASPIQLTGGTSYWLGVSESSSTPTFLTMAASTGQGDGLGEVNLNATNNITAGYTMVFSYSTTLPTISGLTPFTTSAAQPLFFLRAA